LTICVCAAPPAIAFFDQDSWQGSVGEWRESAPNTHHKSFQSSALIFRLIRWETIVEEYREAVHALEAGDPSLARPMSKLQFLDLIEYQNELYVIDSQKQNCETLYNAISLARPELAILDVYAPEAREICSLSGLPTAVRALYDYRKVMDYGKGREGTFGTLLTTLIALVDQLESIVAEHQKD
jgi:hypothetical protein